MFATQSIISHKKQAEFTGFKKQTTIKFIFRKLPSIQRDKHTGDVLRAVLVWLGWLTYQLLALSTLQGLLEAGQQHVLDDLCLEVLGPGCVSKHLSELERFQSTEYV